MKKPQIVYQTVTINNRNVDDFLAAQDAGAYDEDTNSIILFSYKPSKRLKKSVRDEVNSLIQYTYKNRPCTVAHEMHHWRNRQRLGDLAQFARCNYYQEMSLKSLDEMSAFTAGVLYSEPMLLEHGVCPETVAIAMHAGTCEFIDGAGLTYYLDSFGDLLKQGISADLRSGATCPKMLSRQRNLYQQTPDKLFDRRFHNAVNRMFTYDRYCIFRDCDAPADIRPLMDEVHDNMQRAKQSYLDRATEIIDMTLDSIRRR